MLKRKEAISKGRGGWPVPIRLQLISIPILFCWLGLTICACSTSTTPTTTTALPTPSPTEVVDQPLHTTQQTLDGDFSIILDITPNQPGMNVFTAQIIDNHTNQATTNIELTLYITMQDMDMGTDSMVLHLDKNGLFTSTSNILSMSGHWAIGITVQTADHVIHKAGVINLVAPKP